MIEVAFIRGLPDEPAWVPRVLDQGELARLRSLNQAGRPLFLAAHVGVRLLAARRAALGSAPRAGTDGLEAFGWATLPSGKPMLTFRDGRPQPLHVSVSHGGGLAAVAVCDRGPIGIDVERVEPRRDLLAIAERFFSPEESARLGLCAPDEQRTLFHEWWTRKEAVLKATGAGLPGGLTVRVDGPPDSDGWRRVDVERHVSPLYVRDIRTPDDRVFGAIAIEGRPGDVRIVETDLTGRQT